MDRLTSLAIFVAAVEAGSMAGAARRFGISAAMAGRHVGAIEARLQVRLLQRTTRRLSLTDAGRAYFQRCKQLLEGLEEADREAGVLQDMPRGLLRVAAPVAFGTRHLGPVIAAYLADYPDVDVELVLEDRFIDLIEGGVDLAIRIGLLPDSDLIQRRVAPCRMVACAAPAYLDRFGTPDGPEALGRAARLAFSGAVSTGDWTFVDPEGRSHLVAGPCRLRANNVELLRGATLAGAGVAYGPSFVFGADLASGALVQVLPRYRTHDLTIQALYPSAHHVPLKVRRFMDRLRLDFGTEPPWDRWRQNM